MRNYLSTQARENPFGLVLLCVCLGSFVLCGWKVVALYGLTGLLLGVSLFCILGFGGSACIAVINRLLAPTATAQPSATAPDAD
jgi:hypothetical protein